jgi:hypothetical protein
VSKAVGLSLIDNALSWITAASVCFDCLTSSDRLLAVSTLSMSEGHLWERWHRANEGDFSLTVSRKTISEVVMSFVLRAIPAFVEHCAPGFAAARRGRICA